MFGGAASLEPSEPENISKFVCGLAPYILRGRRFIANKVPVPTAMLAQDK